MLSSQLTAVLSRLCEAVNTPRSLMISMLIKAGDWATVVSLRVDPLHYPWWDPEAYAKDVLVTDFLRKCDFAIPGIGDLQQQCWERFEATERLCCATNARLARFRIGPMDQRDLPLLPFIEAVRKEVKRIVGRIPDSLQCGFGPGATLTNGKRLTTVPDKLESKPCGTRAALELFQALEPDNAWLRVARELGSHRGTMFDVARGNRFFTVPKEATKLRGACLSPNVNGYLQKGIGRHLRSRLSKTAGIKIQDEQQNPLWTINGFTTPDIHREIVERSSINEEFATIDLSDASNTIAYGLIQLLLPEDWFDLLCATREGFVERPDGAFQRLEMFSAMGNGFTFELETIVFYAIAKTASKGSFTSVFGDDIIVRTEHVSEVLPALRFFGFQVNKSKTFVRGHFRESCGADFFSGVMVRPHHVKKEPSTPLEWIALANGLRRFAVHPSVPDSRWGYIKRAWLAALSYIPKQYRDLRGPESLGDSVIHDRPESARKGTGRWSHGCWQVRGLAFTPEPIPWKHWPELVVHAAALYGQPTDGPVPRDPIGCYRVKWLAAPEWAPTS